MLRNHFHREVEDLVFINLSRLAAQWEEIVAAALQSLETEVLRRLDGVVGTIEILTASAGQQAPQLREDLQRLDQLRTAVKPPDS